YFGGALAAGQVDMPLEQRGDGGFIFRIQRIEVYHFCVAIVTECALNVIDPGDSAAHAGSKVAARATEDQRPAARHVFATVVADAFHHGRCPRIPDSEAFTCLSADK